MALYVRFSLFEYDWILEGGRCSLTFVPLPPYESQTYRTFSTVQIFPDLMKRERLANPNNEQCLRGLLLCDDVTTFYSFQKNVEWIEMHTVCAFLLLTVLLAHRKTFPVVWHKSVISNENLRRL